MPCRPRGARNWLASHAHASPRAGGRKPRGGQRAGAGGRYGGGVGAAPGSVRGRRRPPACAARAQLPAAARHRRALAPRCGLCASGSSVLGRPPYVERAARLVCRRRPAPPGSTQHAIAKGCTRPCRQSCWRLHRSSPEPHLRRPAQLRCASARTAAPTACTTRYPAGAASAGRGRTLMGRPRTPRALPSCRTSSRATWTRCARRSASSTAGAACGAPPPPQRRLPCRPLLPPAPARVRAWGGEGEGGAEQSRDARVSAGRAGATAGWQARVCCWLRGMSSAQLLAPFMDG